MGAEHSFRKRNTFFGTRKKNNNSSGLACSYCVYGINGNKRGVFGQSGKSFLGNNRTGRGGFRNASLSRFVLFYSVGDLGKRAKWDIKNFPARRIYYLSCRTSRDFPRGGANERVCRECLVSCRPFSLPHNSGMDCGKGK